MALLRGELKKQQFDAYINKLEHLGDDKLKVPLTRAGIYFLRETDKRFRAETSPGGIKWKPLSEYTLMMRRKKGNNSVKILQDTGRLRQSVTIGQNSDSINRISNGVLEVGTAVEYASIHQFGRMGAKGVPPVPQREFLGINEKDQGMINRIFIDWHSEEMLKGLRI